MGLVDWVIYIMRLMINISTKTLSCAGYNTKLYLILSLLFWSFEECRVLIFNHYSEFLTDPE